MGYFIWDRDGMSGDIVGYVLQRRIPKEVINDYNR